MCGCWFRERVIGGPKRKASRWWLADNCMHLCVQPCEPHLLITVAWSQVTEGSGRLLVLAVGERSEWGRTMALVASEAAPTPMQASLGVLARFIAKLGLAIGALCFVVLLVRWAAHQHSWFRAFSLWADGPQGEAG